jgi:hypothetical protein
MNRWINIGIPVIIAVLLVIASVMISLPVTGSFGSQSVFASYQPAQNADAQYARGPQCSGCPGFGQGSGETDPDDVYIPGGATCPACPGYGQGKSGSATPSYRGGCCSR